MTVDFRAVALRDEILLLRQRHTGDVTLYRRTPFARRALLRTTREIERAIDGREQPLAAAHWIELVAPLARALVPDPGDLDEVTTFALHGALQGIPLAALPLPAARARGTTWLGDVTVTTHRPAGAVARAPADGIGHAARVFVVDPSRDLAAGAELGRFYRKTFPGALLLEGAAATAAALRERLPAAAWLHVDAHVRYDPAFPELTELVLADGPLTARQLGGAFPALRLANLSACQSGRWPVTADSGRFGLAGLLARRGAAWVVGTRADLRDELARDFNRAFYEGLAAGFSVPGAYGRALQRVKESHPVTSWAALLLLEAEPAVSGGQIALVRTPLDVEQSPTEVTASSHGGER